jgi:hypothetical protein
MFHTLFHYFHWVLDFMGVNNTYNDFSTHMYNFWSGFAANVSLLAVSGAIVGIYRHNQQRFEKINPVNLVHKIEELEKAKADKEDRENKNKEDDNKQT